MYSPPSKHIPRTHPGRFAPPSRGVAGGVRLPGVTVTGSGSGVSTVRTPPSFPANYRAAPRSAPAIPKPERVRQAVVHAFPQGSATPRAGSGWAQAAGRTAAAAAVAAEFYEAASETADAAKQFGETVNRQYWLRDEPYTGPNLGLTFLENRTHGSYGIGPGIPWVRPTGWGDYTNAVDQRLLNPNSWLRSTVPYNALAPSGYLDNTMPVDGIVANNHYLYVTKGAYWLINGVSLDNYYASVDIYRNLSGAPAPGFVTVPGGFPIPFGVPLPASMPEGYPLAAPQPRARPKPLPRPRYIPEVAIDIPTGPRPVPAVYPARARPPGKKAKENKYYGKAGAAASLVFWLYEATDDWADWINILVNAVDGVPPSVANGNPVEQLKFIRDNPWAMTRMDLGEVLAGLAGWLVDEKFGAYVGEKNRQANRSISTSQRSTIDMRTNVAQQWSPAGSSPGSFVSDFLNTFM